MCVNLYFSYFKDDKLFEFINYGHISTKKQIIRINIPSNPNKMEEF